MRAKDRGHSPLPHYCADDRSRLETPLTSHSIPLFSFRPPLQIDQGRLADCALALLTFETNPATWLRTGADDVLATVLVKALYKFL